MSSQTPSTSLEAKIVVLGSQGVGKTSLVHRFVKNDFIPSNKAKSTVGASFLTTRVKDSDSGKTIRLQIWDTAGQERFRSISRLYYRGSNAAILCYDITDQKSFDDMGMWLQELRDSCGSDIIIQVVGTKADVAASEPEKREVPYERCMGYVAEQLYPDAFAPGAHALGRQQSGHISFQGIHAPAASVSPNSNRSSGFWGQEHVWDCAQEVSAKDGEGIDEVFRVITRKLVEQHSRKMEHQKASEASQSHGRTPGEIGGGAAGYFDSQHAGLGSFRVGYGDKRRSWLGLPVTPGGLTNYSTDGEDESEITKSMRNGRCC